MKKTAPEIVRTKDFIKLIEDKYNAPTTYKMAQLLGVSRNTVKRFKEGEIIKHASIMVKVSELLDVDLSYVIYNILAEEAEKDGEQDVAQSFVQTAQQYAPIGIAITACFCLLFLPYISFV
ncbi:helix-turn-helix domain-containing protein [Endozoicomonas sp.]|uniref:helix-turn-helix domain-containing protein n=1 Tax=Endozoicomonas sp. TaxID=1892382 RepID=UPI003AF9BEA3